MKMKIYLGSDHAGFVAKKEVLDILEQIDCIYEDLGVFDENPIDYPDIAKKVCLAVLNSQSPISIGILICGSGTGMQIAANKFKGIRAAFCYDKYGAKMSRIDNNCNVLTLRAREFDYSKYYEIIRTFLETNFSNEERHIRRINKLEQ